MTIKGFTVPNIWEWPLVLALWIVRWYRPEAVRKWISLYPFRIPPPDPLTETEAERYIASFQSGIERMFE